jgi:hypothetical protein
LPTRVVFHRDQEKVSSQVLSTLGNCLVTNFVFSAGNFPGDTLVGEASRVVVAEACIQALDIPCTVGQTYEVNSIEVEFVIPLFSLLVTSK